VTGILVQVDETVAVGTVLARIATDASPGEPHAAERLMEEEPAERPVRHSPVVQRIAAEHGIDLRQVKGTGRGGRVRKQDVLALVESAAGAREEGPPAPALHTESPYRPESGEPLSRMRRAIGERMLDSLRTAPHCTTIVEADMSRIEEARARLGLTYLPLVARCAIAALREFPQLNATLEDGRLTQHADVNLGIAVSLGDDGLIVPVVRRAHELSAEGLGAAIRELARRARAGELSPDDVRGGTFTITNPGTFGAVAATPIINQPQVAILDLEAVVRRPVVVVDEHGGDAVAVRPIANLCMSWDHRALDGALAARFLSSVRRHVEAYSDG
jgi:pyruvate/2-oxoglutarate dehydrogenase complex dihydrolipoamide acyltransferase (E2) component